MQLTQLTHYQQTNLMKRLFIILSLLMFLVGCEKEDAVKDLKLHTSQNAKDYVQSNLIVKPETQQKLSQDFLKHFFSPWKLKDLNLIMEKIKQEQNEVVAKYQKKSLVGENAQEYPSGWLANIVRNANFTSFPNLKMRAIIIQDANVRLLPTVEPAFESWNQPGEGYPFDAMQQSNIVANTPIFIWHISRDGAWYFIMTESYTGWIQRENIAFIDDQFIKTWQSHKYAVALRDNISLFDQQTNFFLKSRIGTLYPLLAKSAAYYQVFIAVRDNKFFAQTKSVNLPLKYAAEFPLPISTQSVAELSNVFLGNYYGWGGIYGYRDCSATLKDLFATFGIWLPRNSQDQIEAASFIDLSKLSKEEKIKTILEQAVPFFTIVHLPGHIVLYLGKVKDDIFILHDMWGLRTENIFAQSGRKIIGQTVITTLTFGKQYSDVKKTFLDKIDGFRILF